MNMLVAVGLLFLDEETTFWLLMMIIEKMTPQDYYSPGLLGAQADQVCTNWSIACPVLKDRALFTLSNSTILHQMMCVKQENIFRILNFKTQNFVSLPHSLNTLATK